MSEHQKEFLALVGRVLDGKATAAERHKFRSLLREHLELIDAYREQTDIDTLLGWKFGSGQSAAVGGGSGGGVPAAVRGGWRRAAAAAAAAVLVGLTAWQAALTAGGRGKAGAPVRIVRQSGEDPLWMPKTLPGLLSLESGAATVRFQSGVELTLLGPVQMEVRDCMNVRLESGRLLANVPAWETGFTVKTAALVIEDLGTVFSVAADGDKTEAFVFKGSVRARAEGGGGVPAAGWDGGTLDAQRSTLNAQGGTFKSQVSTLDAQGEDGEGIWICRAGEGVRAAAGLPPVKFAAESGAAERLARAAGRRGFFREPEKALDTVRGIADLWQERHPPVPVETIAAADAPAAAQEVNEMKSMTNTVAALAAAAVVTSQGATRYKADNTDSLNLGSSWTGGTAPGEADYAYFDTAFTAGTEFFTGGSLTWAKIRVGSNASTSLKISPSSPDDTLTLSEEGVEVYSGKTLDLNVNMAGSNGLTKKVPSSSYAGTLVLSGASTYTGVTDLGTRGTTILTGTLNPATTLYLQYASSTAGSFVLGSDVQKRDQEIAGLESINANGWISGVAPGGEISTLTVNIGGGMTNAYKALLKDALALVKKGEGTLVLDRTGSGSTWSGGTMVEAGTLLAIGRLALYDYTQAGNVIFAGGTIGVQLGVNWTDAQVDDLLSKATKNSGYFGLDTSLADKTQWAAFTAANFGPLGLAKLGTNTLTLTYANTYTGGTLVRNGTLLVNGSVTGAVNVAAGGTLGGTGVVMGTVTNLGVITAGDTNTIGVFAVTNLVLAENSTYVWNYGDGDQDAIDVTGSLVLPDVATLNVNKVESGMLPTSSVLFNFGSCSVGDGVILEGWTLNGVDKMQVVVSNKQVLLKPRPRGTFLKIH